MAVIESIAAGIAISATTHHYVKPYGIRSQLSEGTRYMKQTVDEWDEWGAYYEPESKERITENYKK